MDEDERRVQSILAFTFKKMDEELVRPSSAKFSKARGSHAKQDGKEKPVVKSVSRGAEWS